MGTFNSKRPSMSVTVTRFVPLTVTVAPMTGSPFSSSTVPPTVLPSSCATVAAALAVGGVAALTGSGAKHIAETMMPFNMLDWNLSIESLYLNCFAASKQTDTGEIKISGNVNCKEAGHTVCIDVWAHGTGIKDLRNTAKRSEYTNYIAYRDEVLSTDNGEYNLLINLAPRKSGLYDVYVSCDCGEDIIKENVIFSDAEETKRAAALLNKAVSDGTQAQKSVTEIADDIAKIVNEYNYSLGVGEEYTADTNTGTIIYNYIKNKPVSENDGNEAVKLCKKAAAISNIRQVRWKKKR